MLVLFLNCLRTGYSMCRIYLIVYDQKDLYALSLFR